MRKNLDNGLLHAMSALVRVVDAGSFTAAGEQMHLTTAQISRLVSELENRLQSKLLHRTTRKLALTSVGEQYVKRGPSSIWSRRPRTTWRGSRRSRPGGCG
ncbi:helix-turn-helix domain-containing protein [Burkholderia gladioli]|uniref:helix-turn-helix domain-containing protein n=1 Tax=Burkholderia gladioli TaxID=28095 RepID=UPI001FC7DD0F|nr:LysR family transcriptional regulator [Burkholderia gladioli]